MARKDNKRLRRLVWNGNQVAADRDCKKRPNFGEMEKVTTMSRDDSPTRHCSLEKTGLFAHLDLKHELQWLFLLDGGEFYRRTFHDTTFSFFEMI